MINTNHSNLSPGWELVFRNLCVKVGQKEIIKEVSGLARPGQMLALMGPSGAGKSTLLNVLGGRLDKERGTVTLNKQPLDKQMRRKISYVLQEDTFLSNLTFWDTIWYTALLRLPQSMPTAEKKKRVDEIIDSLDMRKCLNTIIGDRAKRGLSGGEKKRASIACELLSDPALMLLDEPTSGLDSATAYHLILTLKKFAKQSGKTVVVSIHQPSSQVFNMFDSLLLLCDGEVAYFGELSKCALHFSSIGLECQPHYNLADFILDQVKDTDGAVRKMIKDGASKLQLAEDNLDKAGSIVGSEVVSTEQERPAYSKINENENGKINHAFNGSIEGVEFKHFKHLKDDDSQSVSERDLESYRQEYLEKWPTGFGLQLRVLVPRTFKQAFPRIVNKMRIFEVVVTAVFAGIMWFQLQNEERYLEDRKAILFFIIVNIGFVSILDAVSSVPQERPVLNKERLAGYYRLSAYFWAKNISDFPLLIGMQSVLVTIIFWLSGLNTNPLVYLQILFMILLSSSAAQSFGWFYGALFSDFSMAIMASTTTMLCVMLAGGFYARNIPNWAAWIKYLSFVHYAYHGTLTADLQNMKIRCSQTASQFCTVDGTNKTAETSYIPQQILLNEYTMARDGWQLYHYNLALIGLTVLLRFSTYIILRFIRKPVTK